MSYIAINSPTNRSTAGNADGVPDVGCDGCDTCGGVAVITIGASSDEVEMLHPAINAANTNSTTSQ
jgi:hypothetical protein